MHSEVNIWSLVKSLLHNHNCVIVPSLGGFISHQQSAIIDPVSKTINPPFKHVTFNAQLTLNDGLLVTKVADHLLINYIDAIKIVDEEVGNFYQTLKNNGQFVIEGLGIFVLSNAGKLVFTPAKKANFLIDSFGLENVKIVDLNAPKSTKIISNNVVITSVKPIENTKVFNEDILENEEGNVAENHLEIGLTKRPRKRRNGLAFTAIGTFLMLILGINAYIFLQEGNLTPIRNKFNELDLGLKIKSLLAQNTAPTNVLNTTELLAIYNPNNLTISAGFATEILPKNSTIKIAEATNDLGNMENISALEILPKEPIIEATVESINSTIETTSNLPQTNTFYIIAGAFKSEIRAAKLLAELSKDGFSNAQIILNPKAKSKHLKYFVTYNKFNGLNESIMALDSINENENPDAWIFEMK